MTVYSLLEGDGAHAEPGHPERPARLAAVRRQISRDPLLADLVRISGRPAPREALEEVHPGPYLDLIETFCLTGGGMLDADTYATPASFDVARQSCGNLLEVVDAVASGGAERGFAIGRPPGHHARPMKAMGFSLLANAAVAARHAQAAHALDRVMIVDTDVHHGNGTQEALYDDPSVLVVSSHQANIFPGTGRLEETGTDAGAGFTVNVPLPAGTGDALVDLYRDLLPPLAERFRPDLVLVCAGYDAHRLDPLAGLTLSVGGLVDLVGVCRALADRWAGGRLVLTLEGGYHPDVLAACVGSTLRRLLDPAADLVDPFGPSRLPQPDLRPLAAAVRQQHGL